jgi:hypothetical protein
VRHEKLLKIVVTAALHTIPFQPTVQYNTFAIHRRHIKDLSQELPRFVNASNLVRNIPARQRLLITGTLALRSKNEKVFQAVTGGLQESRSLLQCLSASALSTILVQRSQTTRHIDGKTRLSSFTKAENPKQARSGRQRTRTGCQRCRSKKPSVNADPNESLCSNKEKASMSKAVFVTLDRLVPMQKSLHLPFLVNLCLFKFLPVKLLTFTLCCRCLLDSNGRRVLL